jgi:hypothetical protein
MQELGRNMQAITGAISQEEWVQVVQLAPKVAAHPEPPLTEKMRILAYLGADATKFRNFDAQTHEAALAMKLAAARRRQGGDPIIRPRAGKLLGLPPSFP